jgi:hypothetical protein
MDRIFWPQVESLIALYRILDGKPTLPSTRRWAASPDFLLHLVTHISRHHPKIIVECGAGTSTVAMAFALRDRSDAHIYSIENHPRFAADVREELARRKLDKLVTVINAPLIQHSYPGFEHSFEWYDLSDASIPDGIEMLVVDGPFGFLNKYTRYPAGPELLKRMAKHGHIFVDDALRPDEAALGRLWRSLYPDLGVRELRAEKGALEMFFLDSKITQFLPPGVGSAGERASI